MFSNILHVHFYRWETQITVRHYESMGSDQSSNQHVVFIEMNLISEHNHLQEQKQVNVKSWNNQNKDIFEKYIIWIIVFLIYIVLSVIK